MKNIRIIFYYFVITSALCCQVLSSQVLISEFLANPGKGGLEWIELHNSGSQAVDLSGVYLCEFKNEACEPSYLQASDSKYYQIASKSYLIIQLDSPKDTAEGVLSIDSGLDWRGESVALYYRNGELLDSISFGLQFRDVSCGYKLNSREKALEYFLEPSPGLPNPSKQKGYRTYCEPPSLSVKSGAYLLHQKVALKSSGRYSVIYYTLDGSLPSDSLGMVYESPIVIKENTVLRAVVHSIGKLPSPVVTEHYMIGESNSNLSSISICVGDWEQYYNASQKTERELEAHFTYFNEQGGLESNSPMALTLAGGGSLRHPQKSISLHVKPYFYSKKSIKHSFFPTKDQKKYHGFVLRNAGNAVPKTHFKDAFMHRLVSSNTAIDYLDSKPVNVFINGKYWGIYNLREKKCKHYYSDNHNLPDGELTVVEGYQNRIIKGYSNSMAALLTFVSQNDLRGIENYKEASQLIDLENFIDYYISQIFFANTDWPINNVRQWKVEGTNDSKWRWLLFDLDHGFRANKVDLNSVEYAMGVNNFHSEDYDEALLKGSVLFRKFMENPEFSRKFVNRFADLLNSNFKVTNMIDLLDEMAREIATDIPRHIERWDNDPELVHIKSLARWESAIEDMRNFAQLRPAAIRKHLATSLDLKGHFELTVEQSNGGTFSVNTLQDLDDTFTGSYFTGQGVRVIAKPSKGFQFDYWEGYEKNRSMEIELDLDAGKELRIKPIFSLIDSKQN